MNRVPQKGSTQPLVSSMPFRQLARPTPTGLFAELKAAAVDQLVAVIQPSVLSLLRVWIGHRPDVRHVLRVRV